MSETVKQNQPFVYAQVPENHVPAKYTITKEQIKTAKSAFKTADPSKTGSIPIAKIGEILVHSFTAVNQPAPTQADVSFYLGKYDLDKSGTITKDEYKRLLKELSGLKAYDKESIKKPKKDKEGKEGKEGKKDKEGKEGKDEKHKEKK